MNVCLLKKDINLPLDVHVQQMPPKGYYLFFDTHTGYSVSSAHILHSDISELKEEFKFSLKKATILKNWVVYNWKVIKDLDEGLISLEDAVILMFKGGENPTENQKKVQSDILFLLEFGV